MKTNHLVQYMTEKCPYITVVIPVYNGENYLDEAIKSVLHQTYTNYELIVIDDGSTDSTWDIIESYGDKLHGFHKENGGVSTALNLAIEKMKGEWFAWLSHDDLWLADKLEKQVDWMLQHPNYAMYYGYISAIDTLGNILWQAGDWYPKGKDLRKMTLPGYLIPGITTLINEKCFKTVGLFNEHYRCVQDDDMWFRIASKYDISCLPEVLAKTRVHQYRTGVTMSCRCKIESTSLKIHFISTTPAELYYPELKDPAINRLKKVLLKFWSKWYIAHTRFLIIHNVPTIRHIIWSNIPYSLKRKMSLAYAKLIALRV